jgi:hypothetical protein
MAFERIMGTRTFDVCSGMRKCPTILLPYHIWHIYLMFVSITSRTRSGPEAFNPSEQGMAEFA